MLSRKTYKGERLRAATTPKMQKLSFLQKGLMNMALIEVKVLNTAKVLKELEKVKEESKKVIDKTTNDFKSRGHAWVSSAVTAVYNIKKADFNEFLVGKIDGTGKGLEQLKTTSLLYASRLLTPARFGMTPKTPPAGRSYTLKMKVFKKGQAEVIGRFNVKKVKGGPYTQKSHYILMHTGAKKTAEEGAITHIPFQRIGSKKPRFVDKFTTTQVRSMINNKGVKNLININIDKGLGARFENHMKQALKNK